MEYRTLNATTSNGNYNSASGDATITISKADATIAVNGFSGKYDGNAHAASGSATGVKGEDLSSLFDLGSAFTNVPGGTAHWTFNATSSNGNYNSASGDATITISKANAVIVVTPYSVTYNGNPHTTSGTATGVKSEPLSGLDLSHTTHTNAGTFNADFWTFTDATGNYNNVANTTITDEIDQAPVTVTT